jgi:hypothetical protein
MNQDIFAAHCLVALSHSGVQGLPEKPLDLSLVEKNRHDGQIQLQQQQQQPPVVQGNPNLFMVARILADLNRVRQEPVPQIRPMEGPTLTLKLGPTSPSSQSVKMKTHRCEHEGCGKIYGKSSHLKAHLRTHTGWLYVRYILHFKFCKISRLCVWNYCFLVRMGFEVCETFCNFIDSKTSMLQVVLFNISLD